MSLDVDRPALRSPRSNKRSSFPPASLNHVHIAEAIQRSPDSGATLVFTKANLSDVGVAAAEELATIGREAPEDESMVERIALAYNRVTTLPTEFALLSRLRYLNLKHNSFSVFPDVLTLMPSLDTLDMSNNKIKRLPSQAGQLIHLRVFCLSRNKLARLPTYLSQFHNLDILKVDRNPIEWPPKSVMERSPGLEAEQSMKEWIHSIQQWLDVDASRTKIHDDSGYGEQHCLENNVTFEDSDNSWRFPMRESDFDAGVTPHARSFSVDSNFSLSSSIAESLKDTEMASTPFDQGRPPPLHLGILRSYSAETSPTRSLESYLPSPTDSESFFGENAGPVQNVHLEPQHHARNASYSGELHDTNGSKLLGKKSMPDLRTAKLNFGTTSNLPEGVLSTANTSRNGHLGEFAAPPPLSQHQDSGSSVESTLVVNQPGETSASSAQAIPSMALERNSYFRRLSTLPHSNTLPQPLLCLIGSARSILFALCQVYQTLQHYATHAIDDRLSSVLKKVLDPANVDMMQLINSLDRFDIMGRKMLPPPALCRGVVESCRDAVAVFAKAVGVLALQLKVITSGDDVRYSRWILIELYAATAEVSCAWQTMAPQMEAIKPLLHAKPFSVHSPPVNAGISEVHSATTPTLFHTHTELQLPHPDLRHHPTTILGANCSSTNVGSIRTARRHAGSFSSKDVEIGKKLPSYDDVPSLVGRVVLGVATHTPTLRAPKRQATVPVSASTSSPTTLMPLASTSTSSATLADGPRVSHSRQGSQASLQASSVSSSPSIPSKTTFLDLPSNSKNQVDKEALQAIQTAVEVAPAVWDMMQEMLTDVIDVGTALRESLERARAVTKKLSETVQAMQDADFAAADGKVLRDDAHVFLKMVVQMSNIIKTHGGARPVSSALRSNMVKLTNSTEEFAILLHVSSFSPSVSRSYSPMLSVSIVSPTNSEDIRLGSSLSRSRSALPSGSFKLPPQPSLVSPRSALPTQSFKIPAHKRLRGGEARVDPSDPG